MWQWWMRETGRFRNFKEPGNSSKKPILNAKWWTRFHSATAPGQQTYSCLFTAVRKPHRFFPCIVLGCLYAPVAKQVISPIHVTLSAKNCQHPPPKITCPGGSYGNLQLHEKKNYGKNTTSISFLPWEGDSSPHPTCDAICILYIHAHILYWLLNGHHISYAYLC